ncbi:MAG: N-acetyl-gamma-glutamyl-phosphate reductase [Polyangiales bacterium]
MAPAFARKGERPSVFIDGEAGTTGLGIRQRLAALPAVDVRSVDPARRKDPAARQEMLAAVDVVVLCLPDEAARETVALAAALGPDAPRVLDASSAHRVAPGWVYGLPELDAAQPAAIAAATHVSNPGCYPTGFVALVRPLVDAGLVPADHPLAVHAVSGYSGGGRSMIESYEAGTAPPFELYGLTFEHKHVPEMQRYAGLTRRPVFVPSVGNFRQGMLVTVSLHLDALPGAPRAADLRDALASRYAGSARVRVATPEATEALKGRVEPEALNNTDALELFVFASEARRQAVLVARLDNLGKGASGAAVQNLSLMLGLDSP